MKVFRVFKAKQVDLLTDTGLLTNMAALLSSQVTVNHFCGNLLERERGGFIYIYIYREREREKERERERDRDLALIKLIWPLHVRIQGNCAESVSLLKNGAIVCFLGEVGTKRRLTLQRPQAFQRGVIR